MLGSGGLQTTANVQIKVGVQRAPSFAAFERQFAAFKESLNQVGSISGLEESVKQAAAQARQLANLQRRTDVSTAANRIRVNDRAAAAVLVANTKAANAAALASQRANERAAGQKMRSDAAAARAAATQNAKDIRAADAAKQKSIRFNAAAAAAAMKAEYAEAVKQRNMRVKAAADAMQREYQEGVRQQARATRNAQTSAGRVGDSMVAIFREAEAAKKKFFATLSDARAGRNAIKENLRLRDSIMSGLNGGDRRFKDRTLGLREYVRSLSPATASTKQFTKALYDLNLAQAESARHNARMKTDLRYRLDQTEKSLDAIFRAGFRLQMVGQNLKQIGMRIKDAFGGIMNTFGEFEYNMNRAAGALSIFNKVGTDTKMGINDLQEGLLTLSRESRLFEAKDVAEAMYFWASTTGEVVNTNADLARSMRALDPIMKAAAMTNTSYEATIKGVYSIISQYYNGNVQAATHVTEALFYATQATALEFNDLINAFKMVGPIAKANNVSFEDMVALFGRLGDLGIRGTMAGRAFRQMFIQLVRPSGPAIKAIDALFNKLRNTTDEVQRSVLGGKSYVDLVFPKGKFVGTEKYLNILAAATLRLNNVERNRFLAQITTANELPVLTALVRDQQKALLGLSGTSKDYATQSQRNSEIFKKNWDLLANSWKGVIGSLERGWEHLQIQLGSTLAEVLTPFVDKVQQIIEKIRIWAKENPEVVAAIGRFAAILAGVAIAAGTLLTVLGSIIGMLAGFGLVIKVAYGWLTRIGVGFTAVSGILISVARNVDYIQERFQEAGRIIQDAFKKNSDAVKGFDDIFKSVSDAVLFITDTVVKGFADLIVIVAKLVSAFMGLKESGDILKTLGFIIASVFAARAIAAATVLIAKLLGITKAIAVARAAFVGIVAVKAGIASITTVVGGLRAALLGIGAIVGTGGIGALILGVGAVAYMTNLGGFRDSIESMSTAFRDMKGEVKAAAAEFGKFKGSIESLAERAFPRLTDAMAKTANAMDIQNQVNAATVPTDAGGFATMLATPFINLWKTVAGEAELKGRVFANQEEWIRNIQNQIAGLNDLRSQLGASEITLEQSALWITRLTSDVGNFEDAWKIFYAVAQKPPMSQAELTTMFNNWKAAGVSLGNLDLKEFLNIVKDDAAYNNMKINMEQMFNDEIYEPVFKAIQDALDAGNTELASKLMMTPIIDWKTVGWWGTGGNMLPSPSDMMDMAGASGWTDKMKDTYLSFIGRLGDGFGEGADNEEVLSMAGAMTKMLSGTLAAAQGVIADKFAVEYGNFFSDLSDLIATGDFTSGFGGKNVGAVVQKVFLEKTFEGMSLFDATAAGGIVDASIEPFVSDLVKMLTTQGLISPEWQKQFEASGAEAGTATATNYLAGLVTSLKTPFKTGNLKKAMKLGSDLTQAGKFLGSLMDKTVAKAMGIKHPNSATKQALQARDKAFTDFLTNYHSEHSGKGAGRNLIKEINKQERIDLKIPGLTKKQKEKIRKDAAHRRRQIDRAYNLGMYPPKPTGKDIAANIPGLGNIVKNVLPTVVVPKPDVSNVEAANKTVDKAAKAFEALPGTASTAGTNTPIAFMTAWDINAPAALGKVTTFTDSVKGALNSLDGIASAAAGSMLSSFMSGLTHNKDGPTLGSIIDRVGVFGRSLKGAINPGSAYSIGTSWAQSFNAGMITHLMSGLNIVGKITIGHSPPKMGPLRNIDKGGKNIGRSWGKAFADSSHRETMKGLAKTQRALQMQHADPQVTYKGESERRVRIEVDIKSSDGTANRKTQSEIRDSAIKALSINSVAHLSQVG